jgi:hypothetical protein
MRPSLAEDDDHARRRGLGARAHVQRLHGQPPRLDADHHSSSRIQMPNSAAAAIDQVTAIDVGPRRSSMRVSARGSPGVGRAMGMNSAGVALGSTVAAGRRASRRHLCTRLAFQAVVRRYATHRRPPGASLSASTRCFSSASWRRR